MSADPLIGKRLGAFRIDHLIGRGGMATVYYGWDGRLRRPVAVKVIDARLQSNIAYARRLVSEARIVARWRHQNIIQVYYADQHEGLYYFVMEYVDGPDLGEIMAGYAEAGELIPHADVIALGRAMAGALDYAHAQGVIHRDVKPSNVLLTGDGRVVLTDFGLALDVEQGSVGEVLGTPHYVAPEQARNSADTVPQSDLYSLAVILYEMLTGSVPFDDPSPMTLALMHINEPLPLPTVLNPALNIATEAVLIKALSKAPQDRYQSGAALMDALEAALLAGQPSPAASRLRLSGVPVAQKVEQYLQARVTVPTQPNDIAGQRTVLRATPPRTIPYRPKARQRMILGLLGGGVGLAVLAVIGLSALIGQLGGQPSPMPTPEQIESVTEIVAPGSTSLPTSAPQQEVTSAPTSEPTSLPLTETPQSPAIPPSPTVLYPDGYRLILRYGAGGFYLYNPGSRNIEVRPVVFEALDDASGAPTGYRFEGRTWGVYYPTVESGKCVIIEVRLSGASNSRPAECWNLNAQRTPNSDSSEVFWVARTGSTRFRVVWNGQEIARCEDAAGYCEVFVP